MVKVNLTEFLENHAMEKQDGFIFGVEDQMAIMDYLADLHGPHILSSFEHRPENTGVAMFFHCPVDCRDIVIVFRCKGFELQGQNGLFMIVFRNPHKASAEITDTLIQFLTESFDGSTYLQNEVVKNLNGHIMKSVQVNV